MTRALIVLAALLALSASTALAAPPVGKGKPDNPGQSATAHGQSAEKNAAKKCKAERGTTALSIEAFRQKYGTNANKANAFGKCVSALSKKLEEHEEAEENAAKKCKAERTRIGVPAFKEKYGTNPNKANAFGKCVSKLAKQATS